MEEIIATGTIMDAILDETQQEIQSLKTELEYQRKLLLLNELALQEAGEFAVKRLPHDMRETSANPKYFINLWLQCAVAKRESQRGIENVRTIS